MSVVDVDPRARAARSRSPVGDELTGPGAGTPGIPSAKLNSRGYDSLHAVENPVTSLSDDAERTRKMVKQVDRPVPLVGHSYGGAVITEAGDLPNVVGLVYIAAFAPDADESLGQIGEWLPSPEARECRVGLGRIHLDQAGQVPRELLPGPADRRSARDGRDTEGAGRIDIPGDHLGPGLKEEANLVSGVEGRPHNSPGH